MSDDFIARWSRRKLQARAGLKEVPAEPPQPSPDAHAVAPPAAVVATEEPAPLPPVESLTVESDFTPFMQPGVDATLRRQALKTLLHDPRFNVMDGLDVYIDDYSKPDPLPEGWLEKMTQVARLGEYHEPVPEVRDEIAGNAQPAAQIVPEQAVAPDLAVKSGDSPVPDSAIGDELKRE